MTTVNRDKDVLILIIFYENCNITSISIGNTRKEV